MPKRKGLVKKRRQDCRQCKRQIRGDYAKHIERCEKVYGKWSGWRYFLMDGVTEIEEQALPKRSNRASGENANKDALHPKNEKIIGWNQLRHEKWTCKRAHMHAGLQHAIEKCIRNGLKREDLYRVVGDAINGAELEAILE